jgi:hypothetical protein
VPSVAGDSGSNDAQFFTLQGIFPLGRGHALPDRQYRAWGFPNHPLRDTPEYEMPDGTPPVRAHHDQINVPVSGVLNDFGVGGTDGRDDDSGRARFHW